jgi:hypothetical protein
MSITKKKAHIAISTKSHRVWPLVRGGLVFICPKVVNAEGKQHKNGETQKDTIGKEQKEGLQVVMAHTKYSY